MVSEGLVALGVIGIVFLSIVGCFSICCLCCAVPVWLLFSRLFSPKTKKTAEYQMVTVTETRNDFALASAPEYEAEPLAEAYLVPPLATVHTENSDIVMGVAVDVTTPLQGKSGLSGSGFKDVWAALLFLGNVVFVTWFAVQAYAMASQGAAATDATTSATDAANENFVALNTLVVSCLGLAFVASVMGSVWLSLLMQYSEALIEMVMWTNIILLAVGAGGCLLSGQVWGAVIFGLLAGLAYWFYLSVKHRIPFASAVIRTACAALRAHYSGLLSASYGMMLCQVLWFILWSAASYGVYQMLQPTTSSSSSGAEEGHKHNKGNGDDEQSNAQAWATFGMLISLFWGAQVIQGIVQTTVCGTVACWWFQPARTAPVRGSLFRAVTTSFGSICFGALIVAVIQAVKETLHTARDQAMRRRGRDRNLVLECFIGIAEYLLGCLESALIYFNTYAYCYVAAYGLDFMTSGKQVSALFQRRGWSAIINDTLISRTISMSVLALAVLVGLFGSLASQLLVGTSYAGSADYKSLAATGLCLGLLMGVGVGMILTNALQSAVAMVFVSFAEDPSALSSNHAAEFDNLSAKWRQTYPETIEWMACVSNTNYGGSGRGGSGLYSPTVQAVPVAAYGGPTQVSYLGSQQAGGGYSYQPKAGANPPPVNPMYRESN